MTRGHSHSSSGPKRDVRTVSCLALAFSWPLSNSLRSRNLLLAILKPDQLHRPLDLGPFLLDIRFGHALISQSQRVRPTPYICQGCLEVIVAEGVRDALCCLFFVQAAPLHVVRVHALAPTRIAWISGGVHELDLGILQSLTDRTWQQHKIHNQLKKPSSAIAMCVLSAATSGLSS